MRDYGTAQWEGGDAACDHRGRSQTSGASTLGEWKSGGGQQYKEDAGGMPFANVCGKCGAVRIDQQLGLEKTPEEYIAKMVEVFHEVKRVLRDDGTLWLNIGDSYAGSWGNYHPNSPPGKHGQRVKETARWNRPGYSSQDFLPPTANIKSCKPKDLVGIPWLLAFALRADGWYLRQDIIWAKKNTMPESVTDRCTKSHEYIFLMSKSPRYYFNQEAILEDVSPATRARLAQDVDGQIGSARANGGAKTNGTMKAVGRTGKNAFRGQGANRPSETGPANRNGREMKDIGAGEKRNKRDVWWVGTQPFSEAHFATFPEELIELCILAGCPAGGVVLDQFGGSMTTVKVANNLDCKGIAIELNLKYIEIGLKCRLHQSTLSFSGI